MGYGNASDGSLHITELPNVLTARLDIFKSRYPIIAIAGVVRLLNQDYAHMPCKHNFIYDPVYTKHDG